MLFLNISESRWSNLLTTPANECWNSRAFSQLRTLCQCLRILIPEQETIGTILQRLDIVEYRMQIRDNRSR